MSGKKQEMYISQEELDELMEDLAAFDEKSFVGLAGTDQYEIIPTVTEEGKVLTKDQLKILTKECKKLGLTIIYRIDKEDGETILYVPSNGRTMVLKEGMQ